MGFEIDDEGPPAKKLKLSKAEALPKPSVGEINTNADNPARRSPPERPLSKHELGRKPGPAPKTSNLSHQKQNRLPAAIAPVKFSDDFVGPPLPSSFRTDPKARITQCAKLLCGNYGVLVEDFISIYICIGQKVVPGITKEVSSVLDPEFLQLLELPQGKRAEAATKILKPLDIDSSDKVMYMGALRVPSRASFWEVVRHAFPVASVDESQEHLMIYIGSAAGEGQAIGDTEFLYTLAKISVLDPEFSQSPALPQTEKEPTAVYYVFLMMLREVHSPCATQLQRDLPT